MEQPALQKLLDDVRARTIDVIVVYKVAIRSNSGSPASAATRREPLWPGIPRLTGASAM